MYTEKKKKKKKLWNIKVQKLVPELSVIKIKPWVLMSEDVTKAT